MAAAETTRFNLNKDTWVPLGAVFTIAVVIFGGWRYLEDRFTGLQASFDKMDRRMERLEVDEKRVQEDRWSFTNQRLWVSEFRRLNPTLDIPEAKK